MRWTGLFCIVPLLLHAAVTSVAGCCDAADVQLAAYRNDGPGASSRPLGLRSEIVRALSRLRDSTHDRRLAGDLWLETIDSDRRALPVAPGSSPDDLVAKADAVFDNHRLSWRDAIVRGLDLNVYKDREQKRYALGITRRTDEPKNSVTRTFGVGRRRMQLFIMLPMMYKLGVITTLLIGLVVLSLKGVTISVILLFIALTGLVAKLSKFHNPYMSPMHSAWSGYHYDPYDRSSQLQSPPPPQDKNIHVHVHTAPGPVQPSVVSYSAGPAPSGYAKVPPPRLADDDDDDMNNYNNNYYYNGGGGGGGGAYWNRAGDEYYDAAAMNYRGDNRLQLGAESTTASNSVYHRWLG